MRETLISLLVGGNPLSTWRERSEVEIEDYPMNFGFIGVY